MRKLKTATHQGVIFGSLHESPPDLKEFLGATVADRIARIFNRPLKVIGYQRQKVRANWKLMVENVKELLSRRPFARLQFQIWLLPLHAKGGRDHER